MISRLIPRSKPTTKVVFREIKKRLKSSLPVLEVEEILSQDNDTDASVTDLKSLDEFDINPFLKSRLVNAGIESLFPVQHQSFDAIVQKKDMIGKSPTGSGKTLAFAIPMVQRLLTETEMRTDNDKAPRALVISPTRELAKQIEKEFRRIAPSLDIAAFYGGTDYRPQLDAIRRGLDVVIATPGRLIDLMQRDGPSALSMENIETLVLDEADEMLKMGFQDDVDIILDEIPQDRQLLLWSATVPHWVKRLMRSQMKKDAVSVDLVGDGVRVPSQVKNFAFAALPQNRQLISQRVMNAYAPEGRVLVFTNTKVTANELAHSNTFGKSAPLHGDLSQGAREATMRKFHKGDVRTLVATDVAARGLDIKGVELVIHYDLPDKAESFVHRSGRTGRAGNEGTNVILYSPGDEKELRSLMDEVDVTPIMPEVPSSDGPLANRIARRGRKDVAAVLKNTLELPDDFLKQAEVLLQNSVVVKSEGEEEMVKLEDATKIVAASLMEATDFSANTFSRLTGRKNTRTLLFPSERRYRSKRNVIRDLRDVDIHEGDVLSVALCNEGALVDFTASKSQEVLSETELGFQIPETLPEFNFDERRHDRRGGRGGRYDNRRGGGRGGYGNNNRRHNNNSRGGRYNNNNRRRGGYHDDDFNHGGGGRGSWGNNGGGRGRGRGRGGRSGGGGGRGRNSNGGGRRFDF